MGKASPVLHTTWRPLRSLRPVSCCTGTQRPQSFRKVRKGCCAELVLHKCATQGTMSRVTAAGYKKIKSLDKLEALVLDCIAADVSVGILQRRMDCPPAASSSLRGAERGSNLPSGLDAFHSLILRLVQHILKSLSCNLGHVGDVIYSVLTSVQFLFCFAKSL